MELPLSTNSVPRSFFPRVAIGCRLSLKIHRNYGGSLSVATWYDSPWIGGTASGIEYLIQICGSNGVRDLHLCHVTENTRIRRWSALDSKAFLFLQNSFVVDVRNGDISDNALLSVNVSGPTSRLPVILSWRNADRCLCEFVPVEPGRHTVRRLIYLIF